MPARNATQPKGAGGRFVKKGQAPQAPPADEVIVVSPESARAEMGAAASAAGNGPMGPEPATATAARRPRPGKRPQRRPGPAPDFREPRIAAPRDPRGSWDPPVAPQAPPQAVYDHVDAPDDPEAQALLAKLQSQTSASPGQGARPPQFNAPDLWYARPDGDIVRLQGDALSQAYYRSKGFHILNRDEVRQWETTVRPLVVLEQRKRAAFITTLRRLAERHPGIQIAGDLDITPTEELAAMLEQVQRVTGGTVQVVSGRFREQEVEPVDLSTVEIASGEDLERKLAADAARRGGLTRGQFTGAGSAV
jgi:hypothetical protein